jgi:ComF family protein
VYYFSKALKKIVLVGKDFFFPVFCFGCGKEQTFLCNSCEQRLHQTLSQQCFLCQKNQTLYGERCSPCQSKSSPLDAVYGAYCYDIPLLKELLHTYKYQFVETLAKPLGQLFAENLSASSLPMPDVLMPVPLHPRRLRFRGFNQSLLLAQAVSKNLASYFAIPLLTTLCRVRFTKPQQKAKNREERLAHMQNAFALAANADVQGKVIWLIDDVATTNGTLTACASVLKEAGAKKVYGVVLARK